MGNHPPLERNGYLIPPNPKSDIRVVGPLAMPHWHALRRSPIPELEIDQAAHVGLEGPLSGARLRQKERVILTNPNDLDRQILGAGRASESKTGGEEQDEGCRRKEPTPKGSQPGGKQGDGRHGIFTRRA